MNSASWRTNEDRLQSVRTVGRFTCFSMNSILTKHQLNDLDLLVDLSQLLWPQPLFIWFLRKNEQTRKKIEFILTYMVVNVMVTARLQWDPKLKTCLQVFSIWNRSHIYALPADCRSTYQIWHGIIVVNCN